MKNKIRMGFAAAFTVFTLSIMPVQAGTAAKGSTTTTQTLRGKQINNGSLGTSSTTGVSIDTEDQDLNYSTGTITVVVGASTAPSNDVAANQLQTTCANGVHVSDVVQITVEAPDGNTAIHAGARGRVISLDRARNHMLVELDSFQKGHGGNQYAAFPTVATFGTGRWWVKCSEARTVVEGAQAAVNGSEVAEFYNSSGCGSTPGTGWGGTLNAIGQQFTSLSSLNNLSQNKIVFINNYDNCGSGPMGSAAGVLANFVSAGGVLVIHDRWGYPQSWVPGASAMQGSRQVGTNIDRGPDAAQFTDGNFGVTSNTDLDGGNYSTHGYICSGYPVNTKIALTNGSCAVALAYRYGNGWVYYSTIPLDFYQAGNGTISSAMQKYAKNLALATIALTIQSPTIASVSPTYGSQFGGTAFTLTGTNFTGATSVKIGGVAATNLVVVSATQITAVTPFSSTSGAKDVVVTTPAGSFTAAASFTYTAAVPVLALTNNADSCNPIGATINVDATLSGVVSPIVAGQIYITWNPAKMTLNSIEGGDAPFNNLHTINQTAGTALILVSLEQGGSAVSVQSKAVAHMVFTVAGGSCDGSGTDIQFFPDGTLPTEFTDGVGSKMVPTLIASSGFKVDGVAPVLSPAPADVVVNAGAGMGAFATVALTPPTATDACAPGLTVSSSRSDGAALNAAFPVGTTTVTWSATDPCGNVTRATTRVTVNNYNTGNFSVSYGGSYPASSSRGLTLDIHGSNGNNARSVSAAFNAGTASFSITDLAIANYDCVSIRDTGHSLRRQVAMSAVGTNWSATTTLIAGDLNSNDVIDVVDWGMYIVGNANADLDGNGVINSYDGAIIITNFGKQSDAICGGALMGPPEPMSSISVAELVDLGMADLVAADLNNDGWLDMEDVRISGN